MKTILTRTTKVTKVHEFYAFGKSFFSDANKLEEYKKTNAMCFYCRKRIQGPIALGFALKGTNQLFHNECAELLAKTNSTPISETKW